MAQSYVALITILGGGPYPDNTLPQPQPPQPPLGIWGPTDPRPTHPIAQPPGGWGGVQPPLGIWGPTDPRPTPPIYFPPPGSPPPLGIWGPTDPRPTNPIAQPPGGWGGGGQPPLGFWGPPDPRPTHPIVLPPDLPPTIPPEGELPERPIDWRVGWTAETGWVVVGVPQFPVPTPSKK